MSETSVEIKKCGELIKISINGQGGDIRDMITSALISHNELRALALNAVANFMTSNFVVDGLDTFRGQFKPGERMQNERNS